MIAQQVAGKVTRDALFLHYFPATALPRAVILASVLSIAGSLIFSRLLTRATPAWVVPRLFGLSAVLFALEWAAAGEFPQPVAVALYLHMGVFGLLVISGFWSVVNETFDPHAAKRAVGRIGAGAAFGGVVGGVLADRTAALFDVHATLLLLAALHALCALGVARFGRARETGATSEAERVVGLAVIRSTPYLQQIAWLVAVASAVAGLLDYALKAQADARYHGGEDLVGFFAAFYTIVGVVGFLVQRFLAVPALRRLGLGGTLAVLPISIFVTATAGAVVTRLWAIVAVRASEALLANSLFRSGLELLYTPVAPEKKRPSKAIIDVAAQRGGDLLGAGLVLLILAVAPQEGVRASVALAAALCLVTLYVVNRLHRGYVSQLAESLRRGVITLDSQDIVDATTARTLAQTRVGMDRPTLLREVERYRAQWLAEAETERVAADAGDHGDSDGAGADAAGSAASARAGLAGLARDLLSRDPEKVRSALASEALDARLAALVLRWIAHPELREAAAAALRGFGPRIIGTLEDALLDAAVALPVRARIPSLLESWPERRSAEALLRGLEEPEFGVRFWCAQSLARLVRTAPELRPEEDFLFALALREAEVDEAAWASQEVPDVHSGSVLLDPPQRTRVQRTAEHVFTLLSMVLDRDTLRFSLFGLSSADPNLRGTAIEYLENVLPDALNRALWRYVGRDGAVTRSARSAEELADELQRTISPLVGRRSRP